MLITRKHIILSRVLLALFILPSLWQLEHVFDNNHGVVYGQTHQQIHKTSDTSCALLHKQLKFHSTLDFFVFKTFEKILLEKNNTVFPEKLFLSYTTPVFLRAPPAI